MSLSEFDKETVELIPNKIIIPKTIELPQYQVEESKVSLEYMTEYDKSQGIRMKVVFKRVIMNEVLTTYLPTALLIIISYATNFFSENHFEANLTVNLSVMFVMTTLFVSVMEKLPRTSYIRMVDIWLIYGQLFPFLEVVLVTFSCFNESWRRRR